MKFKAFIERTIAGLDDSEHEDPFARDRERYFDEVYPQFRGVLSLIEKDMNIPLSDRKVIKLYKILRTAAFLLHGGEVRTEDLLILRFVANNETDSARIEERLQQRLSL